MSLTLRCRGPSAQCTLSGVDPCMSIHAFRNLLSGKTGVSSTSMEILTGFPPRAIQVPEDGTVSSLGITNGDTLTVRPGPAPAPAPAPATSAPSQPSGIAPSPAAAPGTSPPAITNAPPQCVGTAAAFGGMPYMDEDEALARAIAASLEGQEGAHIPATGATAAAGRSGGPGGDGRAERNVEGGSSGVAGRSVTNGPVGGGPAPQSMPVLGGESCVVRRVIASDNSCLFNAVGYVMDKSRSRADELRKVVAKVVADDPATFNDGFLGKDVQEYCSWIQQRGNWGGAIELFILSQYYGREIAAFDIQTKRCDVYGQDKGYSDRALLIYDGLHYDALAVAAFEGAPEELDVTMFSPGGREGPAIMQAAEKLVAATHAVRQFTDTANFTLRCGVCQIGLKGEKEAVEHAKATGHANFAEY